MDIRQLTIKSPYAELMLAGKTIETRTKATTYRGLVLIHCAKVAFPWDEVNDLAGDHNFSRINELYSAGKIALSVLGKAIAVAKLVDCRRMKREDEAKSFVKYNSSLYAWILDDIKEIIPFHVIGQRGMSEASDEVKEQIKFKYHYGNQTTQD